MAIIACLFSSLPRATSIGVEPQVIALVRNFLDRISAFTKPAMSLESGLERSPVISDYLPLMQQCKLPAASVQNLGKLRDEGFVVRVHLGRSAMRHRLLPSSSEGSVRARSA